MTERNLTRETFLGFVGIGVFCLVVSMISGTTMAIVFTGIQILLKG